MKRLFAVLAIALAMTFAAACTPDDSASGAPDLESPSLTSPSLESMAPLESPAAS